jgi:hypothetical protein
MEQNIMVAHLDSLQAKINALRDVQSASRVELRPFVGQTLMPSVLDAAIDGEL